MSRQSLEPGRRGAPDAATRPAYRVSQPDEALEREADRVAEALTRQPASTEDAVPADGPPMGRGCLACRAGGAPCPACAPRLAPTDPGPARSGARASAAGVETAVQAVRGGGSPLSADARAYFEPRFGIDLGSVRVHTDVGAQRAAAGLGARAFTLGQSIAFASGEFRPERDAGRRLLAHELTHVLQHRRGAPSALRRVPMEPQDLPFVGRILPWSAALRVAPGHASRVLADLPRDSRVTVIGGRAWIEVEASVGGETLRGFVSHELIEATGEAMPKAEAQQPEQQPGAKGGASAEGAEAEQTEPDHFTYDPALNPELKTRFNRMVGELKRRGIGFGALTGMRSAADAHLFSTAHHIYQGQVPLADLQALPGGKDQDGNLWYDKAWETHSPLIGSDRPATPAEIMERAKAHALAASPRTQIKQLRGMVVAGLVYAEEGYAPDDPRRAPNLKTVPVSVHTAGNAVDLEGIAWERLGGSWSAEAEAFVAGFGLWRPFNAGTAGSDDNPSGAIEDWHFELAPAAPMPERQVQ